MEPDWTQFESAYTNKVNLVMINVDEKRSPEMKKYADIAKTVSSIPATFWVDRNGKVLASKVGTMNAKQLGADTDTATRKAK